MIQWYPGHMTKAKRNLEADLALVDMIIEVLDARVPASSRNPDLRPYLSKKAHVLLLNKEDLANPAATKAWLKYYQSQGYWPAACNAALKKGVKELQQTIQNAARPIMDKLQKKGRLPRPVRAMVVGIPNSGKSTVINALAPQAAAKTGNKPGVTRGRQWVQTTCGVHLLDTPGLLWPRFADEDVAFKLAISGAINDQVLPLYEVCSRLAQWLLATAPQALNNRYKFTTTPIDSEALFLAIGQARGLLGTGGKIRNEDAALLLLYEFRAGKLGRFTLDSLEASNEIFHHRSTAPNTNVPS